MSELKITGNPAPVVGKEESYSVNQLLPSSIPTEILNGSKPNPFEFPVEWSVHVLENGKWIKKEENNKTGNKVSYKFIQKSLERKGIRILAKKGEQTARLDVKPHNAESPKIDSIEFLDKNGNKPTKPFAYGQILKARVHCLHMERRTVYATLWEDDAAGAGHNKANEKNKMKTLPGIVKNGIADIDFVLEPDFAKIANAVKAKGDADEGKTHEYYVTAEILNKKTASTNTNVANPSYKDTAAKPATPKKATPAQKKGPSKKQEKEKSIGDEIVDWWEGLFKVKPIVAPNPKPPTGNNPLKIGEVDKAPEEEIVKIEGILKAFFAKEEFTKETTEVDGQLHYTFANNNNNIDKNKIATIIKKKVDAQVKAEKKYAKLEDIKNALTANSYRKGANISFNLYKLGAEFKKINSAPLEDEVYVVAKTFLLDGKEVTIKIKEKEAIIVDADADLQVLEAKENGSEITILKAVVEKGIAKVKIKLRPKADTDLASWKEKLAGIKDGTHTYKFGSNGNNTLTAEQKKKIAIIIAGKIKATLAGQKKFAKVDAIEKALTNQVYNKDEQITFDVYKSVTENLWLKAECQGDTKKHEGEFLKKDGEYFVIGGNEGCKIDENYFFEEYSKKFNGISDDQKSSLTKMFKSTAEYYAKEKRCCNLKHLAYMLATAKLETAHTFNPINEYGENSYFERMYDPILGKDENRRQMAMDNENTAQGDGVKYHGRGFVQLTWKKNYRRMNEKFGVDLINHPEKALDHELAMKIMIYGMEEGSFTGKKLADYINIRKTDYLNARRIINGTDRASAIEDYSEKIEKCLKIECNCTGKDNTESNVNIHFVGQSAHEDAVSQNSIRILKEVGSISNNNDIYITSTARTPHDQARIMFDNCESDVQEQRNTYLEPGQKVIDVYVSNVNKTRNQVIGLMEAKINELGPSTVSKHCANSNIINVFDISISRLINPNDFLTEIQRRTEVDQVLTENGVYHVEITQ